MIKREAIAKQFYIDDHAVVVELHVVESSESCRILILLTTREIQVLTLYLVG